MMPWPVSIRSWALLQLAILACATTGCSVGDDDRDPPPPDPYGLRSMNRIAANGGRPAWCPAGEDRIAFDRRSSEDGYFDLWLMRADGSNPVCLTAPPPSGFPVRHAGNPSWHPSGKWLLLNAQKQSHPGAGTGAFDAAAQPGIGFNNDLWILSDDGMQAHLLWENPVSPSEAAPQQALYNPRFSHDGTRVAWTHVYNGAEGNWGDFVIRVADFSSIPVPHLETGTLREYDPVPACNFKEVHGWSPDDARLIVSGNWRQQHEYDQDIGLLDVASGDLVNLTPVPADTWTEAAKMHPSGRKVFYMSSEGYPLRYGVPAWWEWLATDYWMMDPDGTNRRRITFFNDPGHPEYTGEIVNVAQFTWNPDGTRMVGVLNRAGASLEIWVYEFGS